MTRIAIGTAGTTLAVSAVVLAGPKFTSVWRAPEASTVSFAGTKVAALIISDDQNLRVSGEEALMRELSAVGVAQPVATYRIVPQPELKDAEKARGWYERAGVDGVVSMRLVKADKRTTWTPSTWSSPFYSTFSGYYAYGWGGAYVYDPGYTRVDDVVVIETLVFSVPQNKLLWAGVTETINPKTAGRVIKDVVEGTVKEMKKQGLMRANAPGRM
jgi:hypothetical protein